VRLVKSLLLVGKVRAPMGCMRVVLIIRLSCDRCKRSNITTARLCCQVSRRQRWPTSRRTIFELRCYSPCPTVFLSYTMHALDLTTEIYKNW
jgi:hypothetical protein